MPQTYRLADLAAAAGVSARTVRYYQDTGLLPRVQHVGRNARYDEGHLKRLSQIATLQESGLKLSAIRDVVSDAGLGKSPVVSLIGVGSSGEAWLSETERTFTVVELAEFLGDRYFDLLKPLEEAGFLERRSDPARGTEWHCADLALLRGALEMADNGASVEFSAGARDLIRRRVHRLADDLAQMWESELGRAAADEGGLDLELTAERVRVVAWQTVAYVMAQEVDHAVRRVIERQAPTASR